MILALDTSTASSSLAIYDGERLLAEAIWQGGHAATAQLLPMARQCFAMVGVAPANLTVIAVALGPGSFNGLRAGVSLAKVLAYALDIPILGLPTPEIAAYPFSSQVLPVCVVLQAGRRRVVRALFQTRYGRWQQVGRPRNTTIEEICQETEQATVFCGEIDAEMAATIRHRLGRRALLTSPALSARRAGYLAEMAWQRFQERPVGDDLAALQPIYLSRPRIGDRSRAVEQEES